MLDQKPKAIAKNMQLDRQYLRLSRDHLISELAITEQFITNQEITEEMKFLYKRRYIKILDALKEKLENFALTNLNRVC